MTPTLRDIVDVLRGRRFPMEDEKCCQAAIERCLQVAGMNARREVKIQGGVIDFLTANGTGIEVKLKGSTDAIKRQLVRYAADKAVTALLLVSAKPVAIASSLRGKPVAVLNINLAWL